MKRDSNLNLIWVLLYFCVYFYLLTGNIWADEAQKGRWQTIRILDLQTAQWIALAENANFAASTARIGQAFAQKEQAHAAYWPTINVSMAASHYNMSNSLFEQQLQSARLVNPLAEIDDPVENYSFNFSISYVLFDGFLSKHQFLAAKMGHEITKVQHQNAKRLLLQQVANLFFRSQLARENVAIAQANIDFYKQKLKEAQARQDIGSGSLSDSLNFQVQLNSAKTTLIQTREIYQLALLEMADALGIPNFSKSIDLAKLEAEMSEELETPDVQQYIDQAFENRPDVLLYDKMIKQAKVQEKASMAYNYPFLKVSAVYQGDRTDNYQWQDDDFGNTVTANLTYPIFSGGYYQAKTKQARYRIKETENNWQYISKKIDTQVRQAITSVKAAQAQLTLQQDNAKLVKQNRDLVEKEYAAGQNSLVRLNEAQRDLITARSRLAAALVSLHQAWQNLLAATGEILLAFE
jgi:outer membrane protein TolC